MPGRTGPTFAMASLRAAIVECPVKLEIFVSRFCQSLQRLAAQFMFVSAGTACTPRR